MPQPHKSQITPADSTILWRYMDLSQFLWMLSTRRLHFSSWRKFHDIYEGDVPPQWVQEKMLRSEGPLPPVGSGYHANIERASRFGMEERLAQFRVSCWHQNEDESIAMWNLYPKGLDGVAIQTTVGDLRASVQKSLMDEHTHIGAVTYDGFPVEYDPTLDNVQVIPLLVKRPWYRHEQEVRMIRWAGVQSKPPYRRRDPKVGENVPVDLARLIKLDRDFTRISSPPIVRPSVHHQGNEIETAQGARVQLPTVGRVIYEVVCKTRGAGRMAEP